MIPQFITDSKGNFYLAFETQLVSGYLPVPIPKQEPILRWRGPKIDIEKEWYPATTFMADFVKHEVVLRLFCTANRSEIVIRPFTQIYGTGMRVTEDPSKEDYEEVAGLGLTDIGTVHSHCSSKAYASGIDMKDEASWPGGLHMTVGELDEDHYDIHARFAWDVPGQEENGKLVRAAERTLQAPRLTDWFRLPRHAEVFIDNEPELAESILGYLLCKAVKAPYPDWWKDKLVAPPPPKALGPSPMKWQGGGGYPGLEDWPTGDFFGGSMHEPMIEPPQPPKKRQKKQP